METKMGIFEFIKSHLSLSGIALAVCIPLRLSSRSGLNRMIREEIKELLKITSLDEYRDLYRALLSYVDSSPDHFWIKDLEGAYLYCNKMHRTWLGIGAGEEIPEGKTDIYFSELLNAQDHSGCVNTFGEKSTESDKQVLQTRTERTFLESGYVNGVWYDMLVKKAPRYDEEGELLGTVGTARCVTERIQQGKALLWELQSYLCEREEKFAPILSTVLCDDCSNVNVLNIARMEFERTTKHLNNIIQKLSGYVDGENFLLEF